MGGGAWSNALSWICPAPSVRMSVSLWTEVPPVALVAHLQTEPGMMSHSYACLGELCLAWLAPDLALGEPFSGGHIQSFGVLPLGSQLETAPERCYLNCWEFHIYWGGRLKHLLMDTVVPMWIKALCAWELNCQQETHSTCLIETPCGRPEHNLCNM